jgi:hypothetical protein
MYVVKRLHEQLLGRPAIKALGLVMRTHAVTTQSQRPHDEFPMLFKGLNHPYSIQFFPGATPFSLSVVQQVAIPLMQPVKEELGWMERMGVVEKPTDWCAGMVVAPTSANSTRLSDLRATHCRQLTKSLLSCQELPYLRAGRQLRLLKVPLTPDSALLSLRHFGSFSGIMLAPEIFQRLMSQML